MIARTEQLEVMAWECRAIAYVAKHDEVRQQLLEVAKQFERLALHYHLFEIRPFARLKPVC